MAGGATITGFSEIMTKLHGEVARIDGMTISGLRLAAAEIRYDMEKTPPLIPVRYGNLRASWFVSSFKTLKGPGLVMGFSAKYAAFVHEMVGAHFSREGAGAKFFEASLRRNERKVLEIIKTNVRIK